MHVYFLTGRFKRRTSNNTMMLTNMRLVPRRQAARCSHVRPRRAEHTGAVAAAATTAAAVACAAISRCVVLL